MFSKNKKLSSAKNPLEEFQPQPHPTKAIINSQKIPISVIAKYLGVSYFYASKILSGIVRATPRIEHRLQELIAKIKGCRKQS